MVASLTPVELSSRTASIRSPRRQTRKPTVTEAREAALAELVPPAIVKLRSHIQSNAGDSWKAAIRVLELAFAKTANAEELRLPTDPAEIAALSWKQMQLIAIQLTAPMLEEENGAAAEGIGTAS